MARPRKPRHDDRFAKAREVKTLKRLRFLQDVTVNKKPLTIAGEPRELADFLYRLSLNFKGGGQKHSRGLVSHYKSPVGRVELSAVQFIPEAFDADGLDFDRAILKSLTERFTKKRRKCKKDKRVKNAKAPAKSVGYSALPAKAEG